MKREHVEAAAKRAKGKRDNGGNLGDATALLWIDAIPDEKLQLRLKEGWRKDQTSRVLRDLLSCKTSAATPADNLLALAAAMKSYGRAIELSGAVGDRFYEADFLATAPHWPPGEGVEVAELRKIWARAERGEKPATAPAENGAAPNSGAVAENEEECATRIRATYWSLDDIANFPEPEMLVEGIMPKNDKSLWFGVSGTYKSTIAVDMLCRCAHSMDFHGLKASAAPLVYIANEDRFGLAYHHVLGWHRYHGMPGGRVIVLCVDVRLDRKQDVEMVLEAAAQAFPGERPTFAIDTWDRSLTGDQDHTIGVNPGLSALDAFAQAGSGTVTNSHSPWSDTNRTKGSVTFWANHPARVKFEKDETTGRGTMKVVHQKHTKPGLAVSFDFELFEFEGKAGQKVSTLIPQRLHGVVSSTVVESRGPRDQLAKLTAEQKVAIEALRDEAAATKRWDFPFAAAQALWIHRGAIDPAPDLDLDPDKTAEGQRKRAARLRQQLAARNLIKVTGTTLRLLPK